MSPTSLDRLIPEPDAARILSICYSTLRRLRRDGTGPAYIRVSGKRGGAIRYRIADIDAWLTQNTVKPKK